MKLACKVREVTMLSFDHMVVHKKKSVTYSLLFTQFDRRFESVSGRHVVVGQHGCFYKKKILLTIYFLPLNLICRIVSVSGRHVALAML
jgi:hypothetical protein